MLPRAARLKRNRDFRLVYARRRSYSCSTLVLYVRPRTAGDVAGKAKRGNANVTDGSVSQDRAAKGATSPQVRLDSRFGFVVSKKTARRAHDRNRIKRRLREICRTGILARIRPDAPVDALLVARSNAVDADFARLAADVETLGRQAGLF